MKARTTALACPGLAAFALRLISELSSASATGNLVFSPLSIYAALALTSAGARGATLQQLLALLGAKSRKDLAKIVRGLSEQALVDRTPGVLALILTCMVPLAAESRGCDERGVWWSWQVLECMDKVVI
ncbi:putative serpin-Z8 [Aegilops tauschii subsp. strangulata]|nr:putative serpin-Z8 [Aegilops tauschii subsp. strangulata]